MNAILLHGKDADPSSKWYPWFAEEMKKLDIDCRVPALPRSDDPILSEWLAEISKLQPDEQSILIGHSRGGVAILRWLEKLPAERKIGAVILIATNSGHSEKMSKSENSKSFFSDSGYDFEKIKSHCVTFIAFHSRDDKTVPFEAGEENVKGLDARFLRFDDRGHFGRTVNTIPELIDEIHRLQPFL